MKKFVLVTGACINTGVAIVEKFLTEGVNVVFTGRNKESVEKAEQSYRETYPQAEVYGYVLNSLDVNGQVDEPSVKRLFGELDEKNIFIQSLVLNAADQGLNMKIFENPLADFQRVINTNVCWNYCLVEQAAIR
ncbi:MAG: SDR family NAD(P)-dependent oxidoreductase, partial [Candidatus Scatosoma sp.]